MEEYKMEEKKVVIIVPFVSLNKYVMECIKNCLRLNYANFKLVLLPNENIVLADELKTDRLKSIPTGDVTIAKKRNIAIEIFPDADYYAFIDSDAYPHADWLKNATRAFLKSDKIGAVGGPNIAPYNESLAQKVVGNALKSFLISGISAFCKKITKNRYCLKLATCNLIVTRKTIMLSHGFNEEVEVGEDQLLCNYIVKSGKKIFFDNTVIVYHHSRFLGKHFFSQELTYGYSVIKMIGKESSLFNLFFLAPAFFLFFLIIGFVFSFFNHTIMSIWLITVAFYLSVLIFDAIRYSDKIIEMPLTSLAILIGNLGYVMGIVLAGIGVHMDIKKIYKNYKGDTQVIFRKSVGSLSN
jgi:cellulose synthase/poly-beta-1,6-N-acetylglucosamine synthase-like glycosyltransferase